MGATLAALSGINNISGPGMIDFESCLSLEKLVVANPSPSADGLNLLLIGNINRSMVAGEMVIQMDPSPGRGPFGPGKAAA